MGFLTGLAEAEIALRDAGLKVRLDPAYAQRMLFVATVPDRGEIAYTTVDGSETRDLARLLGLSEGALDIVDLDGYVFDTEADLEQVLNEAKAEHPDVDLSRVQVSMQIV